MIADVGAVGVVIVDSVGDAGVGCTHNVVLLSVALWLRIWLYWRCRCCSMLCLCCRWWCVVGVGFGAGVAVVNGVVVFEVAVIVVDDGGIVVCVGGVIGIGSSGIV